MARQGHLYQRKPDRRGRRLGGARGWRLRPLLRFGATRHDHTGRKVPASKTQDPAPETGAGIMKSVTHVAGPIRYPSTGSGRIWADQRNKLPVPAYVPLARMVPQTK